jgi:hypothetical protein
MIRIPKTSATATTAQVVVSLSAFDRIGLSPNDRATWQLGVRLPCDDAVYPRLLRESPEERAAWKRIEGRVPSDEALARISRNFTPPQAWLDESFDDL